MLSLCARRVRDGERGLALAQATGDESNSIPYARNVLAQIDVVVGDHPHALAQLDALLAKPYFMSPAWLRIDPTWAPLRATRATSGSSRSPLPTRGRRRRGGVANLRRSGRGRMNTVQTRSLSSGAG